VLRAHALQVLREVPGDGAGQQCHAILIPLVTPDQDLAGREVNILHAQSQALEQSQPRDP
jgi:hypothetical protein